MSKNLKLFTDDASRQTYEQSNEYREPYVGGVSSAQTSSYNTRNIGKYFIDYTRTEQRLSDFDINNKDVIEVEYLESNGTAYIDTGIKCTSKLKVQFEALVTTDVNRAVCGGISNASGSTYFRHHWTPSQSNFYWIQRSSANTSSVTFNYSTNTWYNVIIDPVNGTASINNTSKTFTKITGLYTTNQNYFIFARKAENGDMQSRPSKFKSFKIWDNGILVRDMIPVRIGNTGYMYDKVSRALFENVGTGEFVLGQDKPKPIKYLESTGLAYIDTGIIPDVNTGIQISYSGVYKNNVNVDDFYIVGLRNDSGNTRWVIAKSGSNPAYYYGYGNYAHLPYARSYNVQYTISLNYLNNRKLTLHKTENINLEYEEINLPNTLSFTPAYNIRIFGSAGVNASYSKAAGKMYFVKISQNNNIIMDLIPVRVGNSGYMYDKISGQLFGNSGTDEFVLGPDKKIQ